MRNLAGGPGCGTGYLAVPAGRAMKMGPCDFGGRRMSPIFLFHPDHSDVSVSLVSLSGTNFKTVPLMQ